MTASDSCKSLSWRSLLTVDLKSRSDCHEILDDHTSDHALIAPTLHNLERINVLLSGIRALCRSTLFRDAQKNGVRSLSIADLGCGGGDLAHWLHSQCAKRGIQPRIIGIDHDPRIAAIAQTRCAHSPSISIINGDATDPDLLAGDFDWIVSNHFLHHLESGAVARVLNNAALKARRGVIMNDLARSRWSLVAFSMLCSTLRPSGHTANDGLVSILRSFTWSELHHAFTSAGIDDRARIVRTGISHLAIVIANSRPPCRTNF
jgi:2-polyprenyl-3-methyl-5-hydroxy-6-metoxy-1,4-benzoquinol methylase